MGLGLRAGADDVSNNTRSALTSSRSTAPLSLRCSSGVIKGLLLLPIVVLIHFGAVLAANVIAFPMWLDHGITTVRLCAGISRAGHGTAFEPPSDAEFQPLLSRSAIS
jgi:hypothetical protein